MSEKIRMGLIVACLVVVAGLFSFLFLGSEDKQQDLSGGEESANLQDEKSEATAPKDEIAEPGAIRGKAIMAAGGELPYDLRVELHYVPEGTWQQGVYNSLITTARVGTDGAFEFAEVSPKPHWLVAKSNGFTGALEIGTSKAERESVYELTIHPSIMYSGRVIGAEGKGIENALVLVTGVVPYQDESDSPYTDRWVALGALTDSDGEFSLETIAGRDPEKQYSIGAKADGYANHKTDYLPANTDNIEIRLAKESVLSGTVVNQDTEKPLANATFSAYTPSRFHIRQTTTDKEGKFLFSGLSNRKYYLRIDDDSLVVTPQSMELQVDEETTTDEIKIYVRRGAVVSGRVYDEDSNAGLAGVGVIASGTIFRVNDKDVVTDVSGNYSIRGLHEGDYSITYANVDGYPAPIDTGNERFRVATSLDEPQTKNFALSKGLMLSGTVIDDSGIPLENEFVSGSTADNVSDVNETDEAGRFVLTGFRPEDVVHLTVQGKYLVDKPDPTRLGKTSISNLVLKIGTNARVAGTVKDDYDKPLRGYLVYATDANDPSRQVRSETRRRPGGFFFHALEPGTYNIQYAVGSRHRPGQDPVLKTLTLEKAEVVSDLNIFVEDSMLPSMAIAGRIVDDTGTGIPEVSVRYSRGESSRSDFDGYFAAERLEEGNHSIHFQKRGYVALSEKDVLAGTANLEVVMSRSAYVTGNIVDAMTGDPVTKFEVAVQNTESDQPPEDRFYARYLDKEGRFRAQEIYPNRSSSIWVRADGYADTKTPVTGLTSGELRQGVVIRLEKESVVSETVGDANGTPITN